MFIYTVKNKDLYPIKCVRKLQQQIYDLKQFTQKRIKLLSRLYYLKKCLVLIMYMWVYVWFSKPCYTEL